MDRNTAVDTPAREPQHTGDEMNEAESQPDIRLGHVHLRVADLARATAFYCDVLGFDVTAYGPDFGARRGLPLFGGLPPPHRPKHLA